VERLDRLKAATPVHWVREDDPIDLPDTQGVQGVIEAIDRWRRFAPALATLFKAQIPDGKIESALLPIPQLTRRHAHPLAPADLASRTFLKSDHALPLAGSIKARGGLYAVGESAYYPEKLLKDTRVIAAARALARELAPKVPLTPSQNPPPQR
jgi:D-serine dehydratase